MQIHQNLMIGKEWKDVIQLILLLLKKKTSVFRETGAMGNTDYSIFVTLTYISVMNNILDKIDSNFFFGLPEHNNSRSENLSLHLS